MSSGARVTFFVNDLAGNAIVRAAPLAAALAGEFQVEVVGLLTSGDQVYAPYRDLHDYRCIRVRSAAGALRAAPALARLATGDVLFACKPLVGTLLPARLAARGRRAVLLDVEDDEWAENPVLPEGPGPRRLLGGTASIHSLLARALHPLTRGVSAVTVSTRALQRRYGGTLVRHGPDEARFDPARFGAAQRAAGRARRGLPAEAPVAVFAGRPRPHKGWDVLLDALCHPAAGDWHLAVAGEARHPAFAAAAARLGGRFHFAGALSNGDMPELLALADAAPVPQLATRFAEAQLPAKLLEALAMQVPVIATRVGDAGEILGADERGLLIPSGDAAALALALARVHADGAAARRRAGAGRAWFVANAGKAAMREVLVPLVEAALRRRAPQ